MLSQDVKRPRRGGSPGAEPSRVLFVRDIAANTSELEVQRAFECLGQVTNVFLMPQRHQALVEFATLIEAEDLIRRQAEGERITVRDEPVSISFSKQSRITSPKKEYLSEDPSQFLLFTIFHIKVELDCDAFKKICAPYGSVERVTLTKNVMDTQAIVEFARIEDAAMAKPNLNGADVYAGCNTLRCEYANSEVFNHLLRDTRCLVDEWVSGRQTTRPVERRQMPQQGQPGGILHPQQQLQQQRPRHRAALFDDVPPGSGGVDQAALVSGLIGLATQLSGLNVPGVDTEGIVERLAPLAALLPQSQGQAQSQGPIGPGAAMGRQESTILFLSGLSERVNCDRLFNVLCLYGNVRKIKFFASTRGQAMAEMMDSRSAELCVRFLHNRQLFGRRIVVDYSRQRALKDVREAVPLPDGTSSLKEYDRGGRSRNRFLTAEMARKNQPLEPCPVLYFWGSQPDATEEDMLRLFINVDAPVPDAVEFLNSEHKSGFIYFPSAEDALDAICLANHANLELDGKAWTVRMSFSVSKDGRRREAMDHQRGIKRSAGADIEVAMS